MIEVHNDPAHAKSDGAQSLTPDQFDSLMAHAEAGGGVLWQGAELTPGRTPLFPAPLPVWRGRLLCSFPRRPAGFCRRRGRSLFIQDRPAGSTFFVPARRAVLCFGLGLDGAPLFARTRARPGSRPDAAVLAGAKLKVAFHNAQVQFGVNSRRRVWPARGPSLCSVRVNFCWFMAVGASSAACTPCLNQSGQGGVGAADLLRRFDPVGRALGLAVPDGDHTAEFFAPHPAGKRR